MVEPRPATAFRSEIPRLLILPPPRTQGLSLNLSKSHPANLPALAFLSCKNGVPMTDSRIVAERFGKNHKDVLRAIRSLECSDDFRERNFAPSSYDQPLPGGTVAKQLPMFTMTRDIRAHPSPRA